MLLTIEKKLILDRGKRIISHKIKAKNITSFGGMAVLRENYFLNVTLPFHDPVKKLL